jgi:hypothetical protein
MERLQWGSEQKVFQQGGVLSFKHPYSENGICFLKVVTPAHLKFEPDNEIIYVCYMMD